AAMREEVECIADGIDPKFFAAIEEIARRSRDVVGSECGWPTLGDSDRLGRGLDSARAWRQAAALLTKEKPGRLRTWSRKDGDVYGSDAALKADFGKLSGDLADVAADGWLERLKAALSLPDAPTFTADGRVALAALFAVLRHADAELWKVFRERRQVDF